MSYEERLKKILRENKRLKEQADEDTKKMSEQDSEEKDKLKEADEETDKLKEAEGSDELKEADEETDKLKEAEGSNELKEADEEADKLKEAEGSNELKEADEVDATKMESDIPADAAVANPDEIKEGLEEPSTMGKIVEILEALKCQLDDNTKAISEMKEQLSSDKTPDQPEAPLSEKFRMMTESRHEPARINLLKKL